MTCADFFQQRKVLTTGFHLEERQQLFVTLVAKVKRVFRCVRGPPAGIHYASFTGVEIKKKAKLLEAFFCLDPTAGVVPLLCCFSTRAASLQTALWDFCVSQGHMWLYLKQVKGHSLPTFLSLSLPHPRSRHHPLHWGTGTLKCFVWIYQDTQSCVYFIAVVDLHIVVELKR